MDHSRDRLEENNIVNEDDTLVAHFEIPQLINDFGNGAIEYIGTIDRQCPFTFYTSS